MGEIIRKHTHNRMQEKQQFCCKIWQSREHNKKAELINNIAKELKGLEEGSKVKMHINLLRKRLKKISNWKAPGYDGIHGFWFKEFTIIHD